MNNLFLAICVFMTTLLSEVLFHYFQRSPFEIPSRNIIGLFIGLYLMSFMRSKFSRILLMNMILALSFFQMMHIQFFSIPVYPNAILLFFAESSEIMDTLFENLALFALPLILIIPAITLNLTIEYIFLRKNKKLKTIPYFHFLFIFYLLFNPLRTYFTKNTWGRQPSGEELLGMNIYLSSSYFLGRILPFKMLKNKHATVNAPNIKFSKKQPFAGDIIFIMGESLSSNHMSLFNYERDTTPYLKHLAQDKNFKKFEAISNAVSTDVAIAFLFNITYGINGVSDISSGKSCLFNFAKSQNFETHFYSSQSSQQLRYVINSICPKSIDHFKSLDDIEPNIKNPNQADDHLLIDQLPLKDTNNKNHFIVLHQRGSHSPYNLRYKDHVSNFPMTDNYHKDRVNHYDNTVIDFDEFMKKLISKVSTYQKPLLIIYSSDHGEGLGEEGVFGHAALKRPSFQIPILFYQINTAKFDEYNFPKTLTQFHLSLMLSDLLGFQADFDLSTQPVEYKIFGNDLDGFAGYLDVIFKDGKIESFTKKVP